MTISELILRLERARAYHGDLPVMFENDGGDVWSVEIANVAIAEEDQYPLDWNMPEGFKFFKLQF